MKKQALIKTFLCSQWTISKQICCYSCILIFFTLSIAISSWLLLYLYAYQIFTQDYSQILEQQNLKQMKNFVQLQQLSTQGFFLNKIRSLENLNNFFQFVQQDGFTVDKPFRCLDDVKLRLNTELIQSVFCCRIDNANAPDFDIFFDFTAFMTEIKLPYDFRQPYYTSVSNDTFFGIANIPFKSTTTATRVPYHQRTWYVNHIQKMGSGNSTIQTPPFISADSMVSFALTTNITHKNGTLLGVGGQNQDLRYIPKFAKQNIKFQMVNDDDYLIISPLYYINMVEIYKIYNESLTGFSQEYWANIKNELKTSNLQIKKTSEMNVIGIMKIDNPFSYVILEIDNSEYVKFQQEILEKMSQNYDYVVKLILSVDFALLIIILLIQSCLIKIFKRDIYDIMRTTELKIYQHYFSNSFNSMIQIKSTISIKLYEAYLKLLSCANVTSHTICEYIEDLNYPKMTFLSYNIEQIYEQCDELYDKRLSKYSGLRYIRLLKSWKQNRLRYAFQQSTYVH